MLATLAEYERELIVERVNAGIAALAAVLVALWRRRHDDSVLVEVLAAVLAALAALLWIRVEASAVVPLLAGFVVLTIAAERVELAGLHLPAAAPRTLVLLALPVAAAAASGSRSCCPSSRRTSRASPGCRATSSGSRSRG